MVHQWMEHVTPAAKWGEGVEEDELEVAIGKRSKSGRRMCPPVAHQDEPVTAPLGAHVNVWYEM